MRERTRILCILLCIALLFTVQGCSYEGPYSFRQDTSQVEKVEICEYDYTTGTRTLIMQLSEDKAQEMIKELAAMTCSRYGPGDHPREYGQLMICLTYTNNEVELIGISNIGWIDPDGNKHLTDYHFVERELFDLIVEYVNPELMPDVYPEWR
jgi:hypothetical protein